MAGAERNEIQSVLAETRVFDPPAAAKARAHIKNLEDYRRLADQAKHDPAAYWGARGREELYWKQPFQTVLEWKPPHARWYLGGQTNLAYNCLDRHLAQRRDKVALDWEGEPGDRRALTYGELLARVCELANGLKSLGVGKGDRVGIYMPMVPEAAIAMLACARIGAVHSVVFGGFSSEALRDRMNDAQAKLVITADGGWRKGAVVPLKKNVDDALKDVPTVEKVVVFQRLKERLTLGPKDVAWEALVKGQSSQCEPEWVDSEHPLFILYTSGSTGRPKGVLHTTAGYSVNVSLTTRWIFDLHEDDIYWCTADVGWVTGHSYVVYGPLLNGATSVIYEGAPTTPGPDRFWDIIERHRATVLYTAPTAIRAFMRLEKPPPENTTCRRCASLARWESQSTPRRGCGTAKSSGAGGARWWTPGGRPRPARSCCHPFPERPRPSRVRPRCRCQGLWLRSWAPMARRSLPARAGSFSSPSLGLRCSGLSGEDPERYVKTYFSELPGKYFTGDGARQDKDGYFWLMGRVDDVVNVAGHRLGTMEVESAIVGYPMVAEAAVVGRPDDLKGTALVAFVTAKKGVTVGAALKKEIADHVVKEIGAIARPDEIRFAEALPKTRSGKIMRRLLRDVAAGKQTTGDTTTLEDFSVLSALRQDEE